MKYLKTSIYPIAVALAVILSSGASFGKDLTGALEALRTGKGREAVPVLRAIIADSTMAAADLSEASRQVYHQALEGIYQLAYRYGDEDLHRVFQSCVERDFPENAVLLTHLGQVYHYHGDYVRARKMWERALELEPEHLEARYRLLELREWSEAPDDLREDYQWFVDYYNRTENIPLPDLEWIGRACVKIDKFEWDGAQKAYQEALDASPELESVLVAKGDLWLDRYDPENAVKFYSSIFKFNPESLDAYLGLAETHRENGNFSGLKEMLDRALFLNPHHPLALAYMADVYLYDMDYEEGQRYLDRGFETNPNHPALLAIQATYAIKRKDMDLVKQIEEKVESLFPNPAQYHFLIADCLQRNYLFAEADREYARGLSFAPNAKRAIAAKAMLQSRVSPASAETAYEVMKEAFEQDPYHVRLNNMKNLFRERENFEVGESEHFKVRFPPGAKEVYGGAAIQALEEGLAELSQKFPYKPENKVLVEFYEDATNFSLRISGLPGAGLSGVCFGDILILKAPDRIRPDGFNWGNVLRHELTHMFTLGLSDSRLPRWYTEGLSVAEEWDPNIQSDPLLIQRYQSNDLFRLEDFDQAFHRPPGVSTVWIAYQQSGDAVRYLTHRFGFKVNLELLAEFAKGLNTSEALANVVDVDLETLNRGVRAQVARRVRAGMTPHQAAQFRAKDAPDATAEAQLPARERALVELDKAYLKRDWKDLVARTGEWLKENSRDVPFLEAQALAYYEEGDKRESRKTLESIFDVTSESYIANQIMAWIDRDYRRWDDAVEHLMKAHKILPRNIGPESPIRQAEEILEERRDWKKLYEVVAIRLKNQPTDGQAYRDLAERALDRGSFEVAQEAVRQAVFIEPFNPDTQILWGKTLFEEGKVEEAVERFEVARKLDPQGGKALLALASVQLESGSREGAISLAEQALELDPTLEEARDIIEGLP
ncbi:MAG: tetratricopeptide repeat protein [Candidatus Omnitrophica bacterium]|nr:tetratricopeptide repeat protein [Candidatus Omnitrophota bacterium]